MSDEFIGMIITVTIAVLIMATTAVYARGRDAEREKWCRYAYEDIASYEKCLKTPDWEKKK